MHCRHWLRFNAILRTRTIVSEVQRDVTSTQALVAEMHTMVSDIHRAMIKGQEGNGGKDLLVSDTRTVSTI